MKKAERYIARHTLIPIIAIWAGLTVLVSLFTLLAELGRLRMHYQYLQAIMHVVMTMPALALQILPVCCLVGTVAGLGILLNHNELMVIRTSGLSRTRICLAVIKPVVILIIGSMLLSEFIIPKLQYAAEMQRTTARLRDSQQIAKGVWWRNQNDYMHFNAIMNNRLNGVQIFSFNNQNQLTKTTHAEYAIKDGRKWILKNVSTIDYLPNETKKTTKEAELWNIKLNTQLLQIAMTVPEYLSIRDLFTYIQYMKTQHAKTDGYRLSLYDKLLYPLTIISLLLTGISFIFGPLRSATTGSRIFAGITISILFMLLQKISGPASLVFGFSPVLAALLPIIITTSLSIVLLRRVH
ncbi:MAG: LPS export ABC transporter permease LptG [Endozoicomonadaceae bacterium]|nr:LPS export ABC transporter permease LptG [Endozoicomonadaceae bacterium]MCY4330006.1 LPS export ABC transporter permease LptG [Endozoicomonadaceae bacterium]